MADKEKLIEKIINASGCLRYYAELIADKLLSDGIILPPVKLGDSVWDIYYSKPREWKVAYIGYNGKEFDISLRFKNGARTRTRRINDKLINKNIFLTREDAIKAFKL